MRARKPKDNLGIRTQSLGIAPQEIEYLRVEEDELTGVLGKMKRQKEILDMFGDVKCSDTKKA